MFPSGEGSGSRLRLEHLEAHAELQGDDIGGRVEFAADLRDYVLARAAARRS